MSGIAEAIFARSLSGHPGLREAARGLPGPTPAPLEGAAAQSFADDVEQALHASKIVAYAQGFHQIQAGSAEYGWTIDLGPARLLRRPHLPAHRPGRLVPHLWGGDRGEIAT